MKKEEFEALLKLTEKFGKFLTKDKQPNTLIARTRDFENMVKYQLNKKTQVGDVDTITT